MQRLSLYFEQIAHSARFTALAVRGPEPSPSESGGGFDQVVFGLVGRGLCVDRGCFILVLRNQVAGMRDRKHIVLPEEV